MKQLRILFIFTQKFILIKKVKQQKQPNQKSICVQYKYFIRDKQKRTIEQNEKEFMKA
ncbi:unnamed protein product [Paramecium primaurelia]|uniref:Uncharacterized protein n=1 Tax=Paramecium primaurelia TaxID=5886 RepID=A0A8S1LV41_PARPR|nr:unnamed protein product [Paramecium primaurelia]